MKKYSKSKPKLKKYFDGGPSDPNKINLQQSYTKGKDTFILDSNYTNPVYKLAPPKSGNYRMPDQTMTLPQGSVMLPYTTQAGAQTNYFLPKNNQWINVTPDEYSKAGGIPTNTNPYGYAMGGLHKYYNAGTVTPDPYSGEQVLTGAQKQPTASAATQQEIQKEKNQKTASTAANYGMAALSGISAINASQKAANNTNLNKEQQALIESQGINSAVDSVVSAVPGYGQIYGLAKTAEGIGRGFIEKDASGKANSAEAQALDTVFTPVHEQIINDATKGNWGDAALTALTGGVYDDIKAYTNYENGGKHFSSFLAPTGMYGKYADGGKYNDRMNNPYVGNPTGEIEKQEVVKYTQGGIEAFNLPSHEQATQANEINMPNGSQILSDRLKTESGKTFAKEGKKFDTKKEEAILKDPNSTAFEKQQAKMRMGLKHKMYDNLFAKQESLKQSKVQAYANKLGIKLPADNEASEPQGLSEQSEGEMPIASYGGMMNDSSFLGSDKYPQGGVKQVSTKDSLYIEDKLKKDPYLSDKYGYHVVNDKKQGDILYRTFPNGKQVPVNYSNMKEVDRLAYKLKIDRDLQKQGKEPIYNIFEPQTDLVTHKSGGIHIAPSKRGTFTAAATKHGKSVQGFASQVLAHKENYSPAMVKKANFARNAAKWHHPDGGLIKYDGGGMNIEDNQYDPYAEERMQGLTSDLDKSMAFNYIYNKLPDPSIQSTGYLKYNNTPINSYISDTWQMLAGDSPEQTAKRKAFEKQYNLDSNGNPMSTNNTNPNNYIQNGSNVGYNVQKGLKPWSLDTSKNKLENVISQQSNTSSNSNNNENDNKFDKNLLYNSLLSTGLQAAPGIADMIAGRKKDVVNYGTVTPTFMTPDYTEAKRIAAGYQKNLREMGPSKAEYMNNLLQARADDMQRRYAIAKGYDTANVEIANKFAPLNKDLAMQSMIDTAKNKAVAEDMARKGFGRVTSELASGLTDYRKGLSDDYQLQLIANAYPDYRYDRATNKWIHKKTGKELTIGNNSTTAK